MGQYLNAPDIDVKSRNFYSSGSSGASAFGVYQGSVSLVDTAGSGAQGNTSAAVGVSYVTGAKLRLWSLGATGFGCIIDYSGWNDLDLRCLNSNSRNVQMFGDGSNTGIAYTGGVRTGYTSFAWEGGSQYNDFRYVNISNGWQCLWTQGDQAYKNRIDSLDLSQCVQNGIAIASTDNNWSFGSVRRFGNVATDSYAANTKPQGVWIPFTPTINCSTSGSVAGYSVQSGAYKIIGDSTQVSFSVQASGQGSCLGQLTLVLPVTNIANRPQVLEGMDVAGGPAQQCNMSSGSTLCALFKYDGTISTSAVQDYTFNAVLMAN
jgi:hypothetical protein